MNTVKRTLIAAVTFALSAPAFAYERWVDIQNCSSADIVAVHITHVDEDSYRRNLLGRGVIESGYQRRVEPEVQQGYCRFDVKVEFADGSEEEMLDVNLCYVSTITVDDKDIWADA